MLLQRVIRDQRVHALTAMALLVVLTPRGAIAQASAAASGASQAGASTQSTSTPAPEGWFPEPRFISEPVEFAVRKFDQNGGAQKSGFYPEFSNMNTGAGWVSLGPGYRQYLYNDQLFLDGSAAVSWHFYKMVQGRAELPTLFNDHLTVGVQAMWQDQTQVNFFGVGPDSLESDRSLYRIKFADFVGYASLRPISWLALDGRLGWITRPELGSPAGTFIPDFPSTLVLFADQPGANLAEQPNFLHSEFWVTADTRDHKGHPTSGALYRAGVTLYRDQDEGTFSFNQYQAEALKLVPLADRRWVLAFRGWAVFTDLPHGHEVPFYLQPSIGGHNTLRSYDTFRFHDLNTLVVNAESRWALFEHVDVAAFFDAGNVAGRAADLNLDKTSVGAGIRLHTERWTIARLDVGHGAEGWHVFVRTNDPLRLGRISRRIANMPFAP